MRFDPELFEQRGKRGYWYPLGKPSKIPRVRRNCRGCGQLCLISPYGGQGFCSQACAISGDRNYNWQDDPGYNVAHTRVHALRGKAVSCVWGCQATKYEWANLTGSYDDPWDFAQMCCSCHKRYDYARQKMTQDVLPKRSRWNRQETKT